jgi:hypothetical protein
MIFREFRIGIPEFIKFENCSKKFIFSFELIFNHLSEIVKNFIFEKSIFLLYF